LLSLRRASAHLRAGSRGCDGRSHRFRLQRCRRGGCCRSDTPAGAGAAVLRGAGAGGGIGRDF